MPWAAGPVALAVDHQWVDHQPRILHRIVAGEPHRAGFAIDRDGRDMSAVGIVEVVRVEERRLFEPELKAFGIVGTAVGHVGDLHERHPPVGAAHGVGAGPEIDIVRRRIP